MSLADEIQKLQDLRLSGALSESEFESAKSRLLSGSVPPPLPHAHSFAQSPPSHYAPPMAPLVTSAAGSSAATNQWAMVIHLSQFAGYIVPLAGMVVPIILWQIKKNELPGIDAHGCHAANWIITFIILAAICFVLSFVIIGIPMAIVLGVVGIVFPIIAGIKASSGELWRYPMSFTFFRPEEPVPPAEPASSAAQAGWPDQKR